MYQEFFDDNRQEIMRCYFLNELSKLGIVKKFKKNDTIIIERGKYVAIVVKGIVSQNVTSLNGYEKQLYVIRPGELFGEMPYFCGGDDYITNKAKTDSEVSILCADTLEKELGKNPVVYRHFIHSLTRKFRIVMLQLTNATFNDGVGRIADALLRLSSCSEINVRERHSIGTVYTHQELANNVGCSRITVTRCLNKFLKENIIAYENKAIVIKNPEALERYVDRITMD